MYESLDYAPRHMPQPVHDESTVLHKVQGKSRVTKRKAVRNGNISVIARGTHKCEFPECLAKKKVFKRQEHLKRHVNTEAQKATQDSQQEEGDRDDSASKEDRKKTKENDSRARYPRSAGNAAANARHVADTQDVADTDHATNTDHAANTYHAGRCAFAVHRAVRPDATIDPRQALGINMDILPSYSWTSCCLVDHRFYHNFAPRLWRDPLVTVRRLGLHPNDDLAWYRRFIHKYARSARLQTRCMVRSLDFRAFALRASGLYSTEASERAISESFRALPQLFPQLICLLIDGHPELDPSSLTTARATNTHSLSLLDLSRCRQELTSKLFCPQLFRDLVYLDISYIPGSLKSSIQSSLNPTYLPELRVLKAQGREVDDATAQLLFQTFRLQLWSIDLSDNKLTDNVIDALLASCFSSLSFRNDAHYEVEGKLVMPKSSGSHLYGPFEFVQESTHSASFTHLERYLADAPAYSHRADQAEMQEWQTARSDAINAPRRDDASSAKEMLLGNTSSFPDVTPRQLIRNLQLSRGGITHLCLNRNSFTANGIGRLLRVSLGRLEHFECDNCLYAAPIPSSDESRGQLRVGGVFGLTHLFRPVFSSNLRSLRIHHSFVTQVPNILADGLPLATSLRLSETVFFRRICRVYPRHFVPDMNPRIASITLTNIPARSIGRIIERLTLFLDLASLQQSAIKQTRLDMNGRHTTVLSGLRHIRFELDPDFSDDALDSSTGRDIDYDKLLDPGDDNFGENTFSFFEDPKRNMPSAEQRSAKNEPSRASAERFSQWKSGRLKSPPYSDTESQFISHYEEASNSWTGNVYSVPVWIGPGTIGPHAAVNEYMWNLQDPKLRTDVGPATPDHVAAGVPALTYIFYAAWNAMIFPKNLSAASRDCGAEPLRDVAAAIKDYRIRTRGTPHHWNGKIELVRTNGSSRYHASEYWR
ncbi:hypothetical protein NUW58_g5236 [Xylaria curta]|uniref:Uncharacterized protein n=1 Tax=Xylaria curta TaxID=42375 RepID=A0ACC1P594_9PEZI|nr:hypothetical protein NUW58_g5236 [Xylaria curta]